MIQYSAMLSSSRQRLILWAGDLVTVIVLTAVGFATHDSLDAEITRIAATFLPVLAAWLFVALPSGLLTVELAARPNSLWRVAWAMTLAGVMAAVLRGLLLNRPVAPVFAIVLSGSAVIVMLVWRAIFLFVVRRVK